MTEIEKKALALVSEVLGVRLSLFERSDSHIHEALCRAIEKHEADKAAHAATVEGILNSHEAFRQKVSDAVEHCRACSDPEAWTRIKFELERFIIPKPDPLVAAMAECGVDPFESWADQLREALAKRGLKIVEIER
jgi:hypothetical protein